MRAFSIQSLLATFRYVAPDRAVTRDADRLMFVYGQQAYEAARAYSWREDTGMLYTQNPGHWHRVGLEIARQVGRDNIEAQLPQSGVTEVVVSFCDSGVQAVRTGEKLPSSAI